MEKSKFTEQQIVFALKQAETDLPVAEVCYEAGISEARVLNCRFLCPASRLSVALAAAQYSPAAKNPMFTAAR